MTVHTSPRPATERASLRCCAARALIELGALTHQEPLVELELLARAYPLSHGAWRAIIAAQSHQKSAEDRALLAMFERAQLGIVELVAIAILVAVEDDPLFARATAALQAPVHAARPTLGLLAAACAPLADSQAAAFHALLTGNARTFGIL